MRRQSNLHNFEKVKIEHLEETPYLRYMSLSVKVKQHLSRSFVH